MINLPILDFNDKKGLITSDEDRTQNIMHEHGTYKFTNKLNNKS